jgi:hypothetical protein
MEENARQEEVRDDVVIAYQEIMNKLKVMKGGHTEASPQGTAVQLLGQTEAQEFRPVQEERNIDDNIIELASKETADSIARHIAELKLLISKSLDNAKIKLTEKQEEFSLLQQAISISRAELSNIYEIKDTVNALRILIMAKNEKEAVMERELAEYKKSIEDEKLRMEKERIREQNEYIQKRDAVRKREMEQYEVDKRTLYDELYESRRKLDEEYEAREASLAARENEHQQMKEREARIVSREQEFTRLKEREARHPEELRSVAQKTETAVSEQLTRKFQYDLKVAEIGWSGEKALFTQKIEALQSQIEQLRALQDLYS